MAPEPAGFPRAAPAAGWHRAVAGRAAETVVRVTSRPPTERWWERSRPHWGIENGRPARLDVARRDDPCRRNNRNAGWGPGMFARLANRRLLEGREHQKKPRPKSTTDGPARRAAEPARRGLLPVSALRPNPTPPAPS